MAKLNAPEVGSTIVEEKRTRVEPNTPPKQERTQRPPMWDYFDSLRSPEAWARISLWMRRYEGSEAVFLDKLDGEQLAELARAGKPFSQEYLKAQYGGGKFKFMVKENGELIYSGEDRFAGDPIDPNTRPAAAIHSGNGNGTSDLAQVMNRMMDFIERRENPPGGAAGTSLLLEGARGALDVQKQAFTSAAATIASNPSGAVAPSRAEALLDRLLEAMVTKMMNPPTPTNSVEETLKLMGALKAAGLVGSTGGGGGGNWPLELVRQLPDALGKISDGLKNYAVVQQQNVRLAELQRGGAPAPQPRPIAAVAAQPAANGGVPHAAQNPQAPPPGTQAQADPSRQPWQDMIETQIRNIIARSDTVEDAADESMTVVVNFDPPMPGRATPCLLEFLIEMGEEGLLGMFAASPILSSIPASPQLRAFIRRFIEIGKIELAPPAPMPHGAGAPAATVQGQPLLVPDPPAA
jgi:hypothetical protein